MNSVISVEDLYASLHAIPEPAWKEIETSAFIAKQLIKAGFEVTTNLAGTGVVGILKSGKPGPVLGLRADMDALTFIINDEVTNIHACGHDAHSAMVLAAAMNASQAGITHGALKVIFQPAEEVDAGALGMIDAGVLEDLDILFATHLRPVQELKDGQATPAIYHGSCYMIEATISGLSSHAGRPHLGINAAEIAVQIVNGVNAINLDPSVQHSVKITKICAGGESLNTIPDKAEIAFDLRAQTNDVMQQLIDKTLSIIDSTTRLFNGRSVASVTGGVPAAEINADAVSLAREAISNVLGESSIIDKIVSPGGDDFHYYIKHKPELKAAYIGLGCNLQPGLHHPNMSFNLNALQHGVKIYDYIISKLLR